MGNEVKRCGYVAIVGRPNVGKSTLLNYLMDQKISITSSKPQTTRHRLLGIQTLDNLQIIYVDTPGLHKQNKHALNRVMNRVVLRAINDVDLIMFVVDAAKWTEEDDFVVSKLEKSERPIIIALNKVDQINNKDLLLPQIEKLNKKLNAIAIIPISAKTGKNVTQLTKVISELLPEGEHLFEADDITDRDQRFLVAEIVREKLFRSAGQELPYACTVQIEHFSCRNEVYHIAALIFVEREGQKKIFIGKKGEKLKLVGQRARLDMEKMLGKKVFLQLWIKVKENWSDDQRSLEELGYS